MSGKLKLVVLDPGHNLKNGNRSPDNLYYEWEFNQDVCNRAEVIIKRIPGLDCIKTKEADTYPTSLDMRVQVAHDAGADLFLSQHTNAYGSGWTTPNGFGVYVYPGRDVELAKICLAWCVELLPMNSRGIRERNFYVTRETRMSSVLLETGFHTNKEDVAKLKTSAFRDLAAMVLVRTACEFLQVPYMEDDNIMATPYHIVRAWTPYRDSMSNIATRNDLTLAQLTAFNPHVDDPNIVHEGDMIFLAQANIFELGVGSMNRNLILATRENKKLKADIAEEQAKTSAALSDANELRQAGRTLHASAQWQKFL